MSIIPPNDTFKKQQNKLVRANLKKGFVNAVHVGSRTVDIYYADNPQTIVKNIPIAASIDISVPAALIQKKCALLLFDETNPNDCVLLCVY